MLGNPLPHLLARPCPFKRMGIQAIVLRPSFRHIIDEFGPTPPRPSLQVVVAKRTDQQLRLIEPGGMDRGEPTPPPAGTPRQIASGLPGCMGRVVIVNQEAAR